MRKHRPFALFTFFLIGFAACGWLLGNAALKSKLAVPGPADGSSYHRCDGKVTQGARALDRGWGIDVSLIACSEGISGEEVPSRGNIRLYLPELGEIYDAGDTVRFLARIRKPRAFKNPGSFDHPLYLKTQGIDAQATLAGPKWILKIAEGNARLPSRMTAYARTSVDTAISEAAFGDDAGILKALAIGDRGEISKEANEAFSRTGMAHILSISGLHVGFVALIIFFTLRVLLGWLPRLTNRVPIQRVCAIASVPFVWFYIAAANFPVSAVRAGIMITVFMAALFFMWRRDLISALAAAVFAIAVLMPASIFSVSFQLSVTCVLAIIVLTPVIKERVIRFELLAVTLAATLGSAPLVAYYFHFVSGAGLFANIAAVPFSGFVLMPLVMAAYVLSIIYMPAAVFIWNAAAFASDILLRFAYFLDRRESFFVFSWAPSLFEVILVYCVVALVVFWRRVAYKKTAAAILGALILFDAGYWHMGRFMGTDLKVVFLDVGHGDSIVIRFPDGHVTLVDGGGIKGSEFDVGANIVAPALLRMGIHRVDDLILTHPHHDHYGGLAYIAEKFGPKVIYTNGMAAPEDEISQWDVFLERVKDAGVQSEVVRDADDGAPALTEAHSNAKMEVFAPRPRDLALFEPNDGSLVVRLSYGSKSFLLTGDLMDLGERTLLETGTSIRSDVLKVGHHGSETSTSEAFLHKVDPVIAVISVGENNRYGVPDEAVLTRLERAGVEILRTDRDGAVTIATDGESLDVDTFVKRKL